MLKLPYQLLETKSFGGEEKSKINPHLYVSEDDRFGLVKIHLQQPYDKKNISLKDIDILGSVEVDLTLTPEQARVLGKYLITVSKLTMKNENTFTEV